MFERPQGGERALLVHVNFSPLTCTEDVQELKELTISAGAFVAAVCICSGNTPNPRYFIGSGKAQEIQESVANEKIDVVIVNHPLSPAQERNLEKLLQCRVLDRIGLILDIFASRARTYEGKLQVELAQLQHIASRLVRGWTHLERQKGGIGLRGPGETQLETDRRLIKKRIERIHERLEKVRSQRSQSRQQRQRRQVATLSLIGYTNAGKSTLFNILANASSYAADQLFATLDPTLRQVTVPGVGQLVLADTVGFIRDLPHELIEAFKATLEETKDADLLLQVIDASDEAYLQHFDHVEAVLKQIQAEKVPRLFVFNKIDRLPNFTPKVERGENGLIKAVWISAQAQQGLDLLLQAIAEHLSADYVNKTIELKPQNSALRAKLYQRGVVSKEVIDEQGQVFLTIKLPKWEFEQLIKEINQA